VVGGIQFAFENWEKLIKTHLQNCTFIIVPTYVFT
jgi:hypothetical protein